MLGHAYQRRPALSRYLWPPCVAHADIIFSSCGFVSSILLPAALRAAQTCRYFVYSEADFEVFRPAGATRCTDGGEIWHATPPPPCQISPPSVQRQGCRTPKNEIFYSDLTEIWNINAPQGRIPCAIFTKFAEFVPHFRMRWVLKYGWICSRGYGVMGVLS